MSKDVERITQINDQGEIIGGFVAVIRPKTKISISEAFHHESRRITDLG